MNQASVHMAAPVASHMGTFSCYINSAVYKAEKHSAAAVCDATKAWPLVQLPATLIKYSAINSGE